MPKLLRCGRTDNLAAILTESALTRFGIADSAVFGGDTLSPTLIDYGRLLTALRQQTLLGAVGVLIPIESVTDWPAEIRAWVGQLLQHIPPDRFFVADRLSVEWGPHFGINPKLGEHPAWLADSETVQAALALDGAVSTYGGAIAAALAGQPVCLYVAEEDRQGNFVSGQPNAYHPLHRFVAQYNVSTDLLCYNPAALGGWPRSILLPPERVDQARDAAEQVLCALKAAQAADDPFADLHALLREAGIEEPPTAAPPKPTKPRLELGSRFDPATHYQKAYYDGTGIEYMAPDGTWKLYHGTGLSWEGNELVAAFLTEAMKLHNRASGVLLDIGCSSGDFVRRALARGWDAYGVDISDASFASTPVGVRERLKVLDITSGSGFAPHSFDVVTAWDLLEHIPAADVPTLLAAVKRLLVPGGVFWANICTCGESEQEFEFAPGVEVTQQNSWLLVSGHLTIHRWRWWMQRLREAGFRSRLDLAYYWQVRRAEHPALSQALSWSSRNLAVVEGPKR